MVLPYLLHFSVVFIIIFNISNLITDFAVKYYVEVCTFSIIFTFTILSVTVCSYHVWNVFQSESTLFVRITYFCRIHRKKKHFFTVRFWIRFLILLRLTAERDNLMWLYGCSVPYTCFTSYEFLSVFGQLLIIQILQIWTIFFSNLTLFIYKKLIKKGVWSRTVSPSQLYCHE